MRSYVKTLCRKGPRFAGFARSPELSDARSAIRVATLLRSRRIALLALACLLALLGTLVVPGIANADLVILKNGREIRGKVILEGKTDTVLQVPYGTMTIPTSDIEVIEKEAEEQYLRKSGEKLLAFRDYEQALRLLRRAHQENPESTPCRRALLDGLVRAAENASSKRRFREVKDLVAEATQLDPQAKPLERLKEQLEGIERTRQRLELEAEQAIATSDYAGAHRHLEQLVHGYPEDRQKWRQPYASSALVLGHVAFEEQKFAEARSYYYTALEHEAGFIDRLQAPLAFAEVQLIIPLLEKGDFVTAQSRLQQTIDLLPGNPGLIYHLALATEGAGDLSQAAHLYASIAGPDKGATDARHLVELRTLAENQLQRATGRPAGDPRWRALAEADGTHESRHFVIAHANGPQAAELERYLEHHLGRLVRTWFPTGTKPQWRGKIRVVLHRSREAFHAAESPPAWSQAVTQNERRYGILTAQTVHFNADDPEFLSATLPHELAHVVLAHRVGVGLTAPAWVEEGVATREEPPHKQAFYQRVVAEAAESGELFPLSELLRYREYPDPERIELFYAQSNSVIAFLQERLPRKRFFELLRKLSIHPDPDKALAEGSPYSTANELDGAWKRSLRASTGRR